MPTGLRFHERLVLRGSDWLERRLGMHILSHERAAVRGAQAMRLAQSLPTILSANIVFVVAIGVVLIVSGWRILPMVWTPIGIGVSLLGIHRMFALRQRSESDLPSPRFTVRVIRDSFLIGLPWAVLAMLVNTGVAVRFDGVIGITITCLSCVGVFAMAVTPAAAFTFLATLWIGRLPHLLYLSSELFLIFALLDVIFLCLCTVIIRSVASLFLDRVRLDINVAELNQSQRLHVQAEEDKRQVIERQVVSFDSSVATVLSALANAINRMKDSANQLSAQSGRSRSAVAEVPNMVSAAKRGLRAVDDASGLMTQAVARIRTNAGDASAFVQFAAEDIQRSAGARAHLSRQLDEVDRASDMIRDILRQTNLLALNATIEAARAGPSGAGFSVVAREVKSLSARINDAAVLISQRIDDIRAASEQSVAATQAMEDAAHRVVGHAGQILSASDQQSEAILNIATALRDVVSASEAASEATALVIAGSEEALDQAAAVSETARQVQETATNLHDTVDHFTKAIVEIAPLTNVVEA